MTVSHSEITRACWFSQSLKQMLWLCILFNWGICCGTFAAFSIWLTAPVCVLLPCCLPSQSLSLHCRSFSSILSDLASTFWAIQRGTGLAGSPVLALPLEKSSITPSHPVLGESMPPFCEAGFLYFVITVWFLKSKAPYFTNLIVAEHYLTHLYCSVFAFNYFFRFEKLLIILDLIHFETRRSSVTSPTNQAAGCSKWETVLINACKYPSWTPLPKHNSSGSPHPLCSLCTKSLIRISVLSADTL